METPTPFDLNRAIQQWRDGLAQSPAIRSENLDELEAHLRDSVSTLQTRDLSAEESFLVATKRVGGGALLGKEFGKVNSADVWVERSFWTLVVMQVWWLILKICSIIGVGLQLVFVLLGYTSQQTSQWPALVLLMSLSFAPLFFTSLFVWRAFNRNKSGFNHVVERFANQPIILVSALFVFYTGMCFLFNFTIVHFNLVVNNTTDNDGLFSRYLYVVPGNLVIAGLIFLLARKRLLRIA